MRLGLSSRAAPDATFDELLEICARRGFGAVELEEGHAHGFGSGRARLAPSEAARRAERAGIVIVAHRVPLTTSAVVEQADTLHARLGHLGEALGARILLDGPARIGPRLDVAAALEERCVRAAVVVAGDDALDEAEAAVSGGVGITWDADPALGGLGTMGARLLERHEKWLYGIGLAGGGPETALQDGAGIGELMRHLALAGWSGNVVVSPSSTRYRIAWRTWLGRSGASSCGGTRPGTTLPELLRPVAPAGGPGTGGG